VEWLQLLLGDEVLDIAEQDTSRDQTHLFVQLTGGTVQCLRPLTSKMVFRPSGLNSKSHKQLTAIVDKRHAKVNKLRRMLTEVRTTTTSPAPWPPPLRVRPQWDHTRLSVSLASSTSSRSGVAVPC